MSISDDKQAYFPSCGFFVSSLDPLIFPFEPLRGGGGEEWREGTMSTDPLFENSSYATLLLRKTYIIVVSVFTNQKKSGEDFLFYQIRWKAKVASSVCFAESRTFIKAAQGARRPPAPSPGTALSNSASSPQSFEGVCEHVCFLSVCSVHPLVRCILRCQKKLRVLILGVWKCSKLFSI